MLIESKKTMTGITMTTTHLPAFDRELLVAGAPDNVAAMSLAD